MIMLMGVLDFDPWHVTMNAPMWCPCVMHEQNNAEGTNAWGVVGHLLPPTYPPQPSQTTPILSRTLGGTSSKWRTTTARWRSNLSGREQHLGLGQAGRPEGKHRLHSLRRGPVAVRLIRTRHRLAVSGS